LTHLVSLQQAAGVESHFMEFVRHARSSHAAWSHSWLNPARAMHPFFAAQLAADLAHSVRAKYRWGIKVPARPRSLRIWHCRRELAAANTDVLLIWNRTAKAAFALDAVGAERCIHWEHGAAWDEGREAERRQYLQRVRLSIANSQAAARVLQLRWDFRGELRVCRNALRPSLVPAVPVHKTYPVGPIKLGVAARLFPVKGVALAMHATQLLATTRPVELHVAGAGPELERLQTLARTLGIAQSVHFHGAVRDMLGFYRGIDCLLHPPLTEAFGLVAIEAAAQGCPVIAAAVDGLPEAVADGVSGYCVAPTLPLAEYFTLGGGAEGLPRLVYDPVSDTLGEPLVVDPAILARAVERLFRDAPTFEALSAAGSAHVLGAPTFDQHVHAVMAVVDEFARRH
jgi:glycosyltransferase involved in cell wall biosynthesis